VVSLANNHVGVDGVDGVLDTMATLDAAGIAHCGAGPDDEAARRPATVEVGGVRVGFLGVMQRYDMGVDEDVYAREGHAGPALLRMTHLAADLARLRTQVDVSVVLVHWGRNYREIMSLQRQLAGEIRAAGADLVVGHHPHIAQAVDLSGGAPVLYSLGNAAFGTIGRFHGDRPPYGVVAVVELDRQRVVDVDLRLINVDNTVVAYQPQPAGEPADRAFPQTLYAHGAAAPEC
jgi:poly-gamma-glutamate capsule biosynthesis protein CapA/YwtB (metallophosphatase superfamily)